MVMHLVLLAEYEKKRGNTEKEPLNNRETIYKLGLVEMVYSLNQAPYFNKIIVGETSINTISMGISHF